MKLKTYGDRVKSFAKSILAAVEEDQITIRNLMDKRQACISEATISNDSQEELHKIYQEYRSRYVEYTWIKSQLVYPDDAVEKMAAKVTSSFAFDMVESFRVTSNGSLGISTTSPKCLLTINKSKCDEMEELPSYLQEALMDLECLEEAYRRNEERIVILKTIIQNTQENELIELTLEEALYFGL